MFESIKKIGFLKRPTLGQIIWLTAGLLVAVGLFLFSRGFISCWRLTALAGIPPASCGIQSASVQTTTNVEGTPLAVGTGVPTVDAPAVELPPPWDGASRVTIMIVGLDYGDWSADRSGPSRSDTMMLLTIDPVSKTAGMLSIPRDMWVNIPGFGYSKINNAYAFGQEYKLPGGGPALAMKTVENFLGINIQYYAQVEFTTFEQMIDTIGGVCLTIPQEIKVGRTYEHSVTLQPGYQCLDGKSTLGYARNRYTQNGDVDRAERQQQVILAIRDKVLEPSNFVSLIGQAPTLYAELSGGINTNLSLNDALRLAVLAKDIPLDSIKRGVIDYTMMQDGTYDLNGQQLAILRPYPDKIRELVDNIFVGGSRQPMASGSLEENMKAEAARIVVVNGSGVSEMASRTAQYLQSQGMNVVAFGNTSDYPDNYYNPFPSRTVIIVHAGKPYAMQYLTSVLNLNSPSQTIIDFNPGAPEDILVALGQDWGANNPLP